MIKNCAQGRARFFTESIELNNYRVVYTDKVNLEEYIVGNSHERVMFAYLSWRINIEKGTERGKNDTTDDPP